MKLNFYYRQNCHLCEDMYQLIHPYLSSHPIELKLFDIDNDPVLQEKYALLIPVLTDHLDKEICHHFFDKLSFEHMLRK